MSWLRKQKRTEHQIVEEQLSAYLDGELLPRERKVVEQHLTACPSCRWNLKTLRQTVQWTSELPTVWVPRTFTIPVPARPAPAARRSRFVPVLQGATALVALLLFFVVAGDAMLTGFQPVTMPRPETQTLAREATSPVESSGAVVAATVVAETVVVEQEAESMMVQEAPATEAPAVEEPARVLEEAPVEGPTVAAVAGGGELVEDAREEETAVLEGVAPTASPSEPSLAMEAPAEPSTAMTEAVDGPTLEPAPTEVAMPAPPAQVELGEAGSEPSPEPASDRRVGPRPAILMGVRWVEYVLGVLLIVLVGTTIGAMVWRRTRQ
jgi:anti-sigma factor RsiW